MPVQPRDLVCNFQCIETFDLKCGWHILNFLNLYMGHVIVMQF